MPATQRKAEFEGLCHEHHVKMMLSEIYSKDGRGTPQAPAYACTAPDCHVHYNNARGYFIPNFSGIANDLDMLMLPKVRCLKDGTYMYLAEINAAIRGFRLWICPQCDARHTNEDDLVS